VNRIERRATVCLVSALIISLVLLSAAVAAELKLPNVLGNNMVLQRGMPVPVWGTAAPGTKVTVEFGRQKKRATASNKGKWQLAFAKMAATSQPQTMKISGKGEKIELKNILVGEVWLCSGQSNMAWHLGGAARGRQAIAAAKHPRIRLFNIPCRQSGKPAADVNAAWQVCSPATAGRFSAVGYFFGARLLKDLDVPIGMINASWGGSPIEPWTPLAGYDLVAEFKTGKIKNRGNPTMHNGMVAPLLPFSIRGAIWYQGESNVNGAATYCARMKALILGWRKAWGQDDLSFYFVQLAPWSGYRGGMLPLQWEAQTATLAVPNTGMAVINDTVGNRVGDIHPRQKTPVGNRLALWALAKDYGKKNLVYSGPLYKSMEAKGGKIVIHFDHVGGGLASRNGKPLDWFTIAGEDKKFVGAKGVIVGDTIEVSSDQVEKPVAVRFAWNKTARPNLMNKEALPAGPFRTDRW